MATKAVYTQSMQAKASVLVEQAITWTRATRKSDGLAFVIFPSSKPGKAWYATEYGCNCPSYTHRGACSHQLAVKTEAEQARERAAVKPRTTLEALMDKQLDEGPRPVVSAF